MKTPRLNLPYLKPDQAQKHVTVNEALRQLDMLVQARILEMDVATPPQNPASGDSYILAKTPLGDWIGQGSNMAVYVDGAWTFLVPQAGWRVWDQNSAQLKIFTGSIWMVVGGAEHGLEFVTVKADHQIVSGDFNDTSLVIKDRDLVFGITARVLMPLPSGQKWRCGVGADAGRYGSYIGGDKESTNIGVTGAPQAYYANTPVRITAQSGSLSEGIIRMHLHVLRLGLPPA